MINLYFDIVLKPLSWLITLFGIDVDGPTGKNLAFVWGLFIVPLLVIMLVTGIAVYVVQAPWWVILFPAFGFISAWFIWWRGL